MDNQILKLKLALKNLNGADFRNAISHTINLQMQTEKLTEIDLSSYRLSKLDKGVFGGLSCLKELDLMANFLTEL